MLGTALALSLSTPAHAVTSDSGAQLATVPEGTITLNVVAANGSGCAPGTARVIGNPDKTGFRIRYSNFVAEAGDGADPTDRRKNCQVGVLVGVPSGWTFAIAEAEYRGRARLAAGATGLQRTNYYWQGSSAGSSTEETFAGPVNQFWETSDVAHVQVYVPCDQQRVLNINTELRVDAGSSKARSSMSMMSSEGDVDTLFNFNWVRC
ncbi:DUF4360 domain-containing protein [Micromonospora zhanjiangensis]|uniref:DUF4360 domain-containing protein n=1 Tax=Micromonospora zhanjiangensis TaxID=1522057 RepID=A0ABV8KX28_9ACTN